jgi:hypothetical protein
MAYLSSWPPGNYPEQLVRSQQSFPYSLDQCDNSQLTTFAATQANMPAPDPRYPHPPGSWEACVPTRPQPLAHVLHDGLAGDLGRQPIGIHAPSTVNQVAIDEYGCQQSAPTTTARASFMYQPQFDNRTCPLQLSEKVYHSEAFAVQKDVSRGGVGTGSGTGICSYANDTAYVSPNPAAISHPVSNPEDFRSGIVQLR